MNVTKYQHPIIQKKREIATTLYGGKCFFCGKKFGKYFSFHHLNYAEGRKRYKDFKSTIDYHKYLIPEILADPSRFLLVCRAHHDLLEWAVSIKNEMFWPKFFLGIMATDTAKEVNPKAVSTTRICLENEKRVVAYQLNDNSALKSFLERHCNLTSMFGDLGNETK